MNNKPLEKIDIVKPQTGRDSTLEYGRKTIRCPHDLAELGLKFIKNADPEVFLLVSLDTRNRIDYIHAVSIGTGDDSLLAPREVMKVAILSGASKIAFIHNHSSGNANPDEDDIKITKRIARYSDLFGIKLMDHVIVCDEGRYESFLERGLIGKSNSSPPKVMDIQEKAEDEESHCEECGTTYIIRMLKEGEEYNDFGKKHCPFCGNMTLDWNFPMNCMHGVLSTPS